MVALQPAMELILPNGILPRPAQRDFAHIYLLNHRINSVDTRLHRNHRVFPEFSPAETSHLFTAAAAASAATAISLEALKASASRFTTGKSPHVDTDENFEDESALPQPPAPSSVEEIWNAAWAGLENKGNENGTSINLNTDDGDNAPLTTPILWLQGLRGDARRRLLALSLAALESAINKSSLNDYTATASTRADACNSILKESSVIAANGWLGYLPAGLEHDIPGKKKGNSREVNSTTGDKKERNRGEQQRDDDEAEADDLDALSLNVDWYAIEERISVYCSVVRLLQSQHVIEDGPVSDQNVAKKGKVVEVVEEVEEESLSFTTATTTPTFSLRAAAEASLRSDKNDEEVSSPSLSYNLIGPEPSSFPRSSRVNGWRATQSGTKSESQLFTLAPSVLQDMAVRVADVVAAAYLEEAAQGTWRPAPSSSRYSLNSNNKSSSSSSSSRIDKRKMDINTVNTEMNDMAGRSGGFLSSSNTADAIVSTTSQQRKRTTAAAAARAELLIKQQQEVDDMQSPSPSFPISSSCTTSLEASWWPVFAHPRVASTRQLQRFSNRLILSRWVDTTFYSVVAAYDDRLPLFTLCAPGGLLRVRQAPVRRAAQLSALTGIRYYVSLILEAVDAAAPTLKMLWDKASAAVAWLLTYGLGKGIGLVWKGLKIGVSTAANGTSTGDRGTNSGTTKNRENAISRARLKKRSAQDQTRHEGGTGEASGDDDGGGTGSLILAAGSS